jgi:diguanylate cyclase (GGDEF)-like protein
MKMRNPNLLKNEQDLYTGVTDPKEFAVRLMAGKNQWLAMIRWAYSLFILIFFLAYNIMSMTVLLDFRTLVLILALAAVGNLIFMLALKRSLKFPSERDYELFASMAALQMDFDLVVLTLLAFFSGGFDSPVIVLYIFYIMVATFLIPNVKAVRNTVTAIILVVVLFFSVEGVEVSMVRLTTLIGFTFMLIFTFSICSYLSRNLKSNEEKLERLLRKTGELSVTDGLTNLYNQTHFFLLLRLQMEKSRRYEKPFSIVIFDMDNFKTYNDNNGHLKGSDALKRVGELMRSVFRSSDVMAKYGGDEFVVLLPNSEKIGAFLASDRLREVVEEEPFPGREAMPRGRLTLSLGIAAYPEHGDTIESLLDRADKALYAAKKTGRNKVIIYNDEIGKESQ